MMSHKLLPLGIICILFVLVKAEQEIEFSNLPPIQPSSRFGKETYIAKLIPVEVEEDEDIPAAEAMENVVQEDQVKVEAQNNEKQEQMMMGENEEEEQVNNKDNNNNDMSGNFVAVGPNFGNMAALVPANLSLIQGANINPKRFIGYIPIRSPNGGAFILPAGGVRLVSPEQSVDFSEVENQGAVRKNNKKNKKSSGRNNKTSSKKNQNRRNKFGYDNYVNYNNYYDIYRRGYMAPMPMQMPLQMSMQMPMQMPMPMPLASYYYARQRPAATVKTGKRQKGSQRRPYDSKYDINQNEYY